MTDEDVLFLVIVVLPVGSLGIAAIYFARRRALAIREVENSAPPAAIETFPTIEQLLAKPDFWRKQLDGKVTLVNALSTPVSTEDTTINRYTVYTLDSHGESHDLLESEDEELVAAAGQWTAGLFGTRFQNDTFAKPGTDQEYLAREIRGRIAKRRVQHEGHGAVLMIVSVIFAGLTAGSYVAQWGLTVDFATGCVITGLVAILRLRKRPRNF